MRVIAFFFRVAHKGFYHMTRIAPRTKLLRKFPYEGRRRWRERGRKSLSALLGSRTALCEMRTETTLLPYKSRLFGQNKRRK